jgi:hypothetical protein
MHDFVSLASLWLPILLSAIFVFVVSSVMHMALPYHKSDYRKLPDEDKVMDALRSAGVTPGPVYHFPHHDMKDMKKPEVQEQMKRGPLGLLQVFPSGVPNMGKFLGLWFVYSLVISIFVAYLTGRTRPAGTEYWEVFRVAGTSGFLGYGAAQIQDSIWKGQAWGVTWKHVFDSLIYAVVTAATFGWLWPK